MNGAPEMISWAGHPSSLIAEGDKVEVAAILTSYQAGRH
jgi:hypothetical protein